MTKRGRRIGIVAFLVLAGALTILIFASRPGLRIGDTIPFLKGQESTRKQEIVQMPVLSRGSSRPGHPTTFKWVTDTYVFKESFESLNDRTKKELKSRSYSASNYRSEKNMLQFYAIKDPKTGVNFNVTLNRRSSTQTVVSVMEWREASWFDQAVDWVQGLFHPKEPQFEIHY